MRGHVATDYFRLQRTYSSDSPTHKELKETVNQLTRQLMPWAAKRVLMEGFTENAQSILRTGHLH